MKPADREFIRIQGKPINLLVSIARGRRMRVADPSDPKKAIMVYPSLPDRINAMKTLADKVMPNLRSIELSGPEGAALALEVQGFAGNIDRARRIAFALERARRGYLKPANTSPEKGRGETAGGLGAPGRGEEAAAGGLSLGHPSAASDRSPYPSARTWADAEHDPTPQREEPPPEVQDELPLGWSVRLESPDEPFGRWAVLFCGEPRTTASTRGEAVRFAHLLESRRSK